MTDGEKKPSNFLKAYVKEFTTQNGKVGFNIEINVDDLARFKVNDRGFVRLTMWKKNEAGKYGDTHFLIENDFEPKKQDGQAPTQSTNDDLPF